MQQSGGAGENHFGGFHIQADPLIENDAARVELAD